MIPSSLQGVVRRRVLINYRVDPEVVQRQLPAPFRSKLVAGWAMAGVCLIRLERLRPNGVASALGLSSENAAHRIAVTWDDGSGDEQEGVYIPWRDTGALLNYLVGGRLFPGEHRLAQFRVRDTPSAIDLRMITDDGQGDVWLKARPSTSLPPTSRFASLEEASSFFAAGTVGYSAKKDSTALDGLRLRAHAWRVEPLDVEGVFSSYFADRCRFPAGSVEYDCTLLMRDIPHEWQAQRPAFGCVGSAGRLA